MMVFRDRIGVLRWKRVIDAADTHNCCPDNSLWLNSAANCRSQTMSALLCRWLNSDEVNLSIKVEPATLEKALMGTVSQRYLRTLLQNIGLLHLDDLSCFETAGIAIALLKILPCYQYLKAWLVHATRESTKNRCEERACADIVQDREDQ